MLFYSNNETAFGRFFVFSFDRSVLRFTSTATANAGRTIDDAAIKDRRLFETRFDVSLQYSPTVDSSS
jgi:hypothetical protein